MSTHDQDLQALALVAAERRQTALREEMRSEISDLQEQLREADDRHSADGSMLAAATRVLEGRDREIEALKARVEEAEREREQLRAGYNRVVDSLQSRAQRAEALVKYARAYVFGGYYVTPIKPDPDDVIGGIMRPPVGWLVCSMTEDERAPGCVEGMTHTRHPDLDSALRALKAKGLLPDDVKVSE